MKLTKLKEIGRGGFGIVDKVTDEDGREYARKTFNISQPQTLTAKLEDNVRTRFSKEATIQASIKHLNIVPVKYSKLDVDPPWFLMPLAEASLEQEFEKDPTLSGEFKSMIDDVMTGLDAIHSLGIKHRDLKPANILKFKAKKGGYYWAISDFGLMSLKETQVSSLTETGVRKGSDYYTAPEVAASLKKATVQSDIYSLGCIIHDIVGSEERIVCNEIREKGPYEAILLNCTRKDASRRFPNISAVREALLSVGSSELPTSSTIAKKLIEGLRSEGELKKTDWREISDFLIDNSGTADSHAVLMQLSIAKIKNLVAVAPEYLPMVGLEFAAWVARTAFIFSDCDAIASRCEVFFSVGDVEIRSEVLLALLHMGTRHNRWFVEKVFMRLASPSLDLQTATRLGIDFRTNADDVCRSIKHLEGSIMADRRDLHPELVKVLNSICKT